MSPVAIISLVLVLSAFLAATALRFVLGPYRARNARRQEKMFSSLCLDCQHCWAHCPHPMSDMSGWGICKVCHPEER